MATYQRTEIPVASIFARRRREGDQVYVTINNYYVFLEELPNFVWRKIDGKRTVEQIADAIAEKCGCSAEAAWGATCELLDFFATQSLLSFSPGVEAK
jgi:Coenzyme PQQ synthesis protein D (PqqD)